jgi:hypothetical protein
VISLHYCTSDDASQEPRGRRRRCLLKDCECWFQPRCPQAHYCCVGCQREGERWRRWRGNQRYRVSEGGKARRREQCRRYRERQRQISVAPVCADPPEIHIDRAGVAGELATATSADVAASTALKREGERPAEFFEAAEARPCDRPGCYCLFVPKGNASGQRFCCVECRRALRRVLDREARWRQRRRRRWSNRRWGPVRPP